MRTAAKRDTVEREIIQALEAIGCTVYQIDEPADLLVGYRKRNFLLEVKSHGGKLTENQSFFSTRWRGQYMVVWNADQAIDLVTRAYTAQTLKTQNEKPR